MAWAEQFMAVLDAPSKRSHCSGGDAGAFSEGFCRLPRSRCPEDLVAGRFEAFPHCRKGARLARAGNSDHEVQGMAGSEQTLGDFGLSLGETEASGKLCPTNGRSCLLRAEGRAGALGQAVGEVGDAAFVFDHAGCRPNRLPSTRNEREGDGLLMREHFVNCAVQQRDREAVQMRRHSDDDVGASEGLLGGEPPARAEQFGSETIEDIPAWRLVGEASSLDLRRQLRGWVARKSQFLLPARHEVLDGLMAFAVPGGARCHRAGTVGGVRADGRFYLGRAVGVYFPGLFRYARDGPTAQATGAPWVRLDP